MRFHLSKSHCNFGEISCFEKCEIFVNCKQRNCRVGVRCSTNKDECVSNELSFRKLVCIFRDNAFAYVHYFTPQFAPPRIGGFFAVFVLTWRPLVNLPFNIYHIKISHLFQKLLSPKIKVRLMRNWNTSKTCYFSMF